MTIIRLDKDNYLVGAVTITRTDDGWGAIVTDERPLFVRPTLDAALDLAADAIELLRPNASPPCAPYTVARNTR